VAGGSVHVTVEGKCTTWAARLVGMVVLFVTLKYKEFKALPSNLVLPKSSRHLMWYTEKRRTMTLQVEQAKEWGGQIG